jgi:hypothetical protein
MRLIAVLVLCTAAASLLAADPPKETEKERPAKLDRELLDGIEDKQKVLGHDENRNEAFAYRYTLLYASGVTVEALRKAARKDIAFNELFEQPSKYRGEVVHLEGRLKLLTPLDSDALLRDQGIKKVYEGWIFPEGTTRPMCVVFSELPANVETSAKNDYRVDYAVECDAYFFKIDKYPTEDNGKKKDRLAPLFLGRTVRVQEKK